MTDVLAKTDSDNTDPTVPEQRPGMVVGIDGSPGSQHALRWAAARTARFGPVTPVVAWHYPWWAVPTGMPGGPPAPSAQEFADQAKAEGEQALAAVDPALPSALTVAEGTPGHCLVDAGRSALLIVVGTRGRGAVADAVLGSVSSHVVRHATVPVAVIPEHVPVEDDTRRVVVGVDGSPNAVAALAWAMRYTPPGATLEAVHAWTYHLSTYPDAATLSVELFEEEAKASLARTVEEATARAAAGGGAPGHEVVSRLEYGDPRTVLMGAAEGADLLVLGARGHEGVAHLLVGSVTTSLVHKPVVATVVVPAGA